MVYTMKKFKRAFPALFAAVIALVFFVVWVFLCTAQAGTKVTLSDGLSQHLKGFTLQGVMTDNFFTQTLCLKDGVLQNRFLPYAQERVNAPFPNGFGSLALPQGQQYGPFEKENESYVSAFNTDTARVMANVNYLDEKEDLRNIRFDSGLRIYAPGEIHFNASRYYIDNKPYWNAPNGVWQNDNIGALLNAFTITVDGALYCAMPTQPFQTGDGGIWRIAEGITNKEIQLLPKEIAVETELLLSPSTEYGKAEKLVNYPRENGGDVLYLATEGESLCLFTMENEQIALHVYNQDGKETDYRALPLSFSGYDKLAFKTMSAQRAGDITFSIDGFVEAGSPYSALAAGGVRIQNGKITHMQVAYARPFHASGSTIGTVLSEDGEQLLVMTEERDITNANLPVMTTRARIYQNDQPVFSGEFLYGIADDAKWFHNTTRRYLNFFVQRDEKGRLLYLPNSKTAYYQSEKEAAQ